DLNEALMELGATVCTPATPSCLLCPVRELCRAFAEGRQGELPVKGKKKATPVVKGVAVVITRSQKPVASSQNEEVLLMRRPVGVRGQGRWGRRGLAGVLRGGGGRGGAAVGGVGGRGDAGGAGGAVGASARGGGGLRPRSLAPARNGRMEAPLQRGGGGF